MIEFNNAKDFITNVYHDFQIKEILLEDMAEYKDKYPNLIYFIDTNLRMVAHWNTEQRVGTIRTMQKHSNWSKSKRKFKKLNKKELFKLLKI